MMPTARRLLPVLLAGLAGLVALPGVAAAAGGATTAHDSAPRDRDRSPLIFNGRPLASSAEAPWSVLLQRVVDGQFQTYCSANVLTPTVVVTAAHCAVDDGVTVAPTEYRIQAGGTTENQPGAQVIGVAGIAVHPYYKGFASGDDVSVMVLASPLAVSANTAPIPLAPAGSEPRAGKALAFFGWGLIAEPTQANPAPTGGLRAMTTTARSSTLCAPGVPGIACAYNPQASPCGGDSGGGLVRALKTGGYELVGLDSFGATQCRTGQADGYADLTQPEVGNFVRAVLAGKPSRPPRAPRAKRLPVVQPVSAFSTALRCTSAHWNGKHTKVRTYFAYEGSRKVIQRGRRTTFTVRGKSRNRFIFCGQSASNKGGQAAVESRNARKVF